MLLTKVSGKSRHTHTGSCDYCFRSSEVYEHRPPEASYKFETHKTRAHWGSRSITKPADPVALGQLCPVLKSARLVGVLGGCIEGRGRTSTPKPQEIPDLASPKLIS